MLEQFPEEVENSKVVHISGSNLRILPPHFGFEELRQHDELSLSTPRLHVGQVGGPRSDLP